MSGPQENPVDFLQQLADVGLLTPIVEQPVETGIPGGDLAPAEAVNFQVFQKADALQILNCPTFSLDQGSYFTELNKFMRNLVSVTEAKNAAWNNALARYEARIDDEFKTPIFQDFIEDDEDYKKTWQQELDAQRRYVSLQGGDMEAISQQISILKLADNRIDFKSL
ncbi:uncharacterized protein CCOS01_04195 [Colletotrichum costaricense]|uniref:Uncharacterized protein n=1 Tax=Colletotrichum costaricense TaxID=1209916 RepID=A0AAI9Z3K0_9PEZI|nr:uncharacterized protein CCOS01_04195 [Colletotrichum costaricense]KAK1532212.1 hypothetical protein CCOS01_04195 [Colletotrichum costaricense]